MGDTLNQVGVALFQVRVTVPKKVRAHPCKKMFQGITCLYMGKGEPGRNVPRKYIVLPMGLPS